MFENKGQGVVRGGDEEVSYQPLVIMYYKNNYTLFGLKVLS